MTAPVVEPVVPPVVPPVTPPAEPPKPTPPADPPKADTTDWKEMARKHEARAKENKAAADELAALKAANATDAEKVTARAETAEKRVADLTDRTVKAEVRALATEGFADPSDAALFLDLAKYVNDAGDIDNGAITTDLAALLTSKPHLAKPTGPPPPPPFNGGPRPPGAPAGPTTLAQAINDRITKPT